MNTSWNKLEVRSQEISDRHEFIQARLHSADTIRNWITCQCSYFHAKREQNTSAALEKEHQNKKTLRCMLTTGQPVHIRPKPRAGWSLLASMASLLLSWSGEILEHEPQDRPVAFYTVSWGFWYSWALCVVGWPVVPDVSKYCDDLQGASIEPLKMKAPRPTKRRELHTKDVASVTFQMTECSATPLWDGIPSPAVKS